MTNKKQDIAIIEVDWSQYKEQLRKIRTEVFIEEQQVPKDLEWDEQDENAIHIIAQTNTQEFVGTARLVLTGQIGRMAVTSTYRGYGVGGAMLDKLITIARNRALKTVFLHAQVHAIEFYQAHGFIEEGDIFMDANIPHKMMILA
jgi:predicted GNAT family N-acyltransferase